MRFLQLAFGFMTLLAMANCSSTTSTGDGGCEPSSRQSCIGTNDCVGEQVCSDAKEWGDCLCQGASGGTSAQGTGGVGPIGGGASSASGGAVTGGETGGVGTGGGVPTGGVTGTGGAATGGMTNAGGASVTGGSPNTGGWSDTGGVPATGGVAQTGGTTSGTGGGFVTGGTASGGIGGTATGGSGGSEGGAAGSEGGAAGSEGGAAGNEGGAAGSDSGGSGGTGGSAGFSPCPTTAGTACNVMPVGDSITEGCCTAPMGGYRMELYRQALANDKNITFVGTLTNGPDTVDGQPFPKRHEGHGGWKIAQIAGVIDNAISSSNPHIVLLKIGTNDINGNDDINNAPNRLASLIDKITNDAPNALLVVSAIIPTTNDGTNQRVQAYNTAIRAKAEAAAAAGKHVVFVDNYAAFTDNANYKTALMADGLHPNTAGYEVLGESFYNVISGMLPDAL